MKHGKIILTTILCTLGCFALVLTVQAVTPAPDGGYAGNNTAEGTSALFNLSSGIDNTALGFQALFHDTTGNSNTAEGFRALFANTNGHQNTATGVSALGSNTTGDFNTANGVNALNHNIDGGNNTATGVQALFSNTSGNFNTATGVAALFHNTIGYNNCALGSEALYSNISGIYNTAVGTSALFSNNGSDNTAVGHAALSANGDGIQNTATGINALANNSSGNFNTAVGAGTLIANNMGVVNTAVGASALERNISGGANTALGYGAGANVLTGSFNVYIGTDVAGVPGEVGHTYISNISSTVQPPGTDVEYVTVNLNTKLLGHSSSSRRYKEDIKRIMNASEALYRLKPVTYRYKKEIDPKQSAAFGLIAEEVAEINPHLVARNSKGQPESVHYEMVNVMLLNEFLKEHKRVETQQSKIDQQQATITELKAEVAGQRNTFQTTAARHEKEIQALTASVKEQASQIQTVSSQIQMNRPTAEVVLNYP